MGCFARMARSGRVGGTVKVERRFLWALSCLVSHVEVLGPAVIVAKNEKWLVRGPVDRGGRRGRPAPGGGRGLTAIPAARPAVRIQDAGFAQRTFHQQAGVVTERRGGIGWAVLERVHRRGRSRCGRERERHAPAQGRGREALDTARAEGWSKRRRRCWVRGGQAGDRGSLRGLGLRLGVGVGGLILMRLACWRRWGAVVRQAQPGPCPRLAPARSRPGAGREERHASPATPFTRALLLETHPRAGLAIRRLGLLSQG